MANDQEIELVKEAGAMVVHCPVANMSCIGVAPVPNLSTITYQLL